MALTFVQNSNVASNDAAGTTLSITFPSATTAGNLVVFFYQHEGGADTGSNVSGDGTLSGGTYQSHANGDMHSRFSYKLITGTGTTTYTLNTASVPFRKAVGMEFSYTGTLSFDQQTTATGTLADPSTGPISSGNITTTGTDEVVLGGRAAYNSTDDISTLRVNDLAADGSNLHTAGAMGMWRRGFTGTFTGDADCVVALNGSNREWNMHIISFSAAAAGGSAQPNRLTLLGVGA